MARMIGRPGRDEAADSYFTYIDQVPGDDALSVIDAQLENAITLFEGISDPKSLFRYAPEKWSIRQVVNHISDAERTFAFRALWFARGFGDPLPSFDQTTAANAINSDAIPWEDLIEDFRNVRLSTLSMFRNMPEDAWTNTGIASGNRVTVRALAFIIPGHVEHHLRILRERYLG
jgi:hypothetical protein